MANGTGSIEQITQNFINQIKADQAAFLKNNAKIQKEMNKKSQAQGLPKQ